MSRMICRILMMVALFGLLFGACTDDDNGPATDSAGVNQEQDSEPTPEPNALLHPGPIGDGRYVLPNGRMVEPAGTGLIVDKFAIDLAVSPDGATLVVVSAGFDRVRLIDTATMTSLQELEVGQAMSGAVWNKAGTRFWVSGGGSHVVYEYEFVGGVATETRRITVHNYPNGLALSPNEKYLYVACLQGKRLAIVNLQTGRESGSIDAHLYSYDVKISSDGKYAFVSDTGRALVSVLDLDNQTILADIEVGANPEGLALSSDDSTLYVANSDSDTVSVIDVEAREVAQTWPIYPDETQTYGASPVAIAVNRAGTRVYVACSGANEITVFNAGNGEILGRIPTGWYATNLRLDEERGVLYYTSGKGYGSYLMGLYDNWRSTVHVLDIPDAEQLAEYTDQQEAALNWSVDFFDLQGVESPIPLEYGQASAQIKHVIFILKENKTYDQILGDLEGTEHDPNLVNFGWDNTPNHHYLAETFTNCDNMFVEGDTSVLGHLWGTFGILNDHAEKAFIAGDSYPLPDLDPSTRPQNGTIFERLLDNGIEFRSYGQIIGFISDFDRFGPYIDFKYGFWNIAVSDEVKVKEILREWELGIFPPFIYISLPADHTYGSDPGQPSPQWQVGDNDAALGTLIDWLSNSEYWDSTAVFVTEDDPQSGADHVDPHRTIGFVISPWARHGHVSSVLYSMSSIWHTIELILGLPPSSKYSRYAAPMYDCFTMEPNTDPYEAVPNPIPFSINPKGLPFADYCAHANFSVPDQVPRMGEVLWALTRPGEPFPFGQSLSGQGEADEDAEEAQEYLEAIAQAEAWAAARGIKVGDLGR